MERVLFTGVTGLAPIAIAAGTTGQVLTATTGGQSSFQDLPSYAGDGVMVSTDAVAPTLSLLTLTTGEMVSGATNAIPTVIAAGTTGQVLTGVTGFAPTFQDPTSTFPGITTGNNIVFQNEGGKLMSVVVGTLPAAGGNSFGTVTLVGGTITVSTTSVTGSSIIFLSRVSIGSTGANPLGLLTIGPIVIGASFDIVAADPASASTTVATDVSVVAWMIVN